MVLAVALGCALATGRARAQSCHLGSTPESEPGFLGFVRGEAAQYENRRYSGHYEGLLLGASYRSPAAGVAVVVPSYHLLRNGLDSSGLGDIGLEGRFLPLREQLALGGVLALTLPTGNADEELGMGHAMVALGVLSTAELDFLSAELILGFGQALSSGSSTHSHHASGLSPLVAPMNASELQASLAVSARPNRRFSTRLALSIAAPVGEEPGASRGATTFGVALHEGRARLGLDASLPVVGDAFRAKAAVELGVQF